jgi:hypothetical protein
MEVMYSSKTFDDFHRTTWLYIAEERPSVELLLQIFILTIFKQLPSLFIEYLGILKGG